MPRIDFYVLSDQSRNGRLLLACRLAEKAYGLGHKIYIHAGSREQAQQLDDLLWTFREGSFVPHAVCPVREDDISPVLIGWETGAPARVTEVLINLSPEVPEFFEHFERLAELVDQNEDTLQSSRKRFRFYREKGYSPQSHRL